MRNNRKLILIFSLILSFACLTGCGKKNEPPKDPQEVLQEVNKDESEKSSEDTSTEDEENTNKDEENTTKDDETNNDDSKNSDEDSKNTNKSDKSETSDVIKPTGIVKPGAKTIQFFINNKKDDYREENSELENETKEEVLDNDKDKVENKDEKETKESESKEPEDKENNTEDKSQPTEKKNEKPKNQIIGEDPQAVLEKAKEENKGKQDFFNKSSKKE